MSDRVPGWRDERVSDGPLEGFVRVVAEQAGTLTADLDLDLATAATRALAADAVLICELCDDGTCRATGSHALSQGERDVLLDAPLDDLSHVGAARLPVRVERLGLSIGACEASRLGGMPRTVLAALKRDGRGLRNVGLARAFAAHAAVALALRRERPGLRAMRVLDDGRGALDPWIVGGGDDAELTRRVACLAESACGAAAVARLRWNENRATLEPLPRAFGIDEHVILPSQSTIDWRSAAARVFVTGVPYVTNDADGDPGTPEEYVEHCGVERLMTVPLEVGGHRIGVLELANKPASFTARDVGAVASLSRDLALAMDLHSLRERLVSRQRTEEVLAQIAREIARGRGLQEFLGTTLDDICSLLGLSLIALVPGMSEPLVRRRDNELSRLEPILWREAREASAFRTHGASLCHVGEPGWSVAHVPIVIDREQVATVSAARAQARVFDPDECRALARLADLIALAWTTERYQRQLAEAARVAERDRIAGELHDQVAQLLFSARLSLDAAAGAEGLPAPADSDIQRGRELVLRADAALREVMVNISPGGRDGLVERLAAAVHAVEEEFGRAVQLDIAPDAAEVAQDIDHPTMGVLARAAREALVNAAKHAGPCQLGITLRLSRRNRLVLTVTDHGVGLRTGCCPAGYGTAAVQRAVRLQGGSLRVESGATGGTRVIVSVPV
jgi:signal transduction histidine kinase